MHAITTEKPEPFQHVPKYFRIQQELLENIRTNTWSPGTAIPSEAELCAQYGVSRGTIRRALDELDRQGLILRSPGRPTVVSSPKIPLLASGFRADIKKKGMRPGTEVLCIQVTPASGEVAQLLDIPPGSAVLLIERIITADAIPLIFESAHIARPTEPITPEDVINTSLLELIPAKCHVFLSRAVESYEPILLSSQAARLLRTRPGDLGMKDQAVLYDSDDRPLYVSTAVVRGDKARIVTETSFQVNP